jgi:hypothetical protein
LECGRPQRFPIASGLWVKDPQVGARRVFLAPLTWCVGRHDNRREYPHLLLENAFIPVRQNQCFGLLKKV